MAEAQDASGFEFFGKTVIGALVHDDSEVAPLPLNIFKDVDRPCIGRRSVDTSQYPQLTWAKRCDDRPRVVVAFRETRASVRAAKLELVEIFSGFEAGVSSAPSIVQSSLANVGSAKSRICS